VPPLLTTRDVLRYGTVNGAKHLRLDGKVGSLTPGKEADIIILDAESINVAPLNHVPGAVVSLMDRTNVETVIVAGQIRKWKGKLVNVNIGQAAERPGELARLRVRDGGGAGRSVQPRLTARPAPFANGGRLRPPVLFAALR
jgi:cytosine/adenosine deaminase-related metal-dependent hydrolase